MSFGTGVLVFLGVLFGLLVLFLRSGKPADCEHRMRLAAMLEEGLGEYEQKVMALRERVNYLKKGC